MATGIKPTTKEGPTNSILKTFLKQNKEHHYNFEKEISYKVSSGSLKMDFELNGGFGPGLHRFVGMNEGGKSSESLEVMKNFLQQPNSRGLFITAEGRLSKEIRKRSGIDFCFDDEKWDAQTCFVFESNIFEVVLDLMRTLIMQNPEKIRYCFILDSIDGLIMKDDLNKSFDDAHKVASFVSTKRLLERVHVIANF